LQDRVLGFAPVSVAVYGRADKGQQRKGRTRICRSSIISARHAPMAIC
jgi:hypothetical protein